MVLPGAVLFPDGILPLRIFEPRYRAMLEYALDHDRMFCVALMKPRITEAMTEDQFFHTAGIGLISASVTQADGTSNLMLQGLARVRLAGFVQLSPFRIARVRPLSPVTNDLQETAALAQDLREQCSNIRINGSPLPDMTLTERSWPGYPTGIHEMKLGGAALLVLAFWLRRLRRGRLRRLQLEERSLEREISMATTRRA